MELEYYKVKAGKNQLFITKKKLKKTLIVMEENRWLWVAGWRGFS